MCLTFLWINLVIRRLRKPLSDVLYISLCWCRFKKQETDMVSRWNLFHWKMNIYIHNRCFKSALLMNCKEQKEEYDSWIKQRKSISKGQMPITGLFDSFTTLKGSHGVWGVSSTDPGMEDAVAAVDFKGFLLTMLFHCICFKYKIGSSREGGRKDVLHPMSAGRTDHNPSPCSVYSMSGIIWLIWGQQLCRIGRKGQSGEYWLVPVEVSIIH